MSDPYGTTPPGPNDPGPPQYGQPGSYGGMPAAPRPADPYGAAALMPPLRVGDALRFAWAKFRGNAATWILVAVLLGAVNVAFNAEQVRVADDQVQAVLDGESLVQAGATFGATTLSLVGTLLTAALTALAIHAALREADGDRPTFASYFRGSRTGTAILTSIVVALLTGIAAVISLGIGGIVVAIFTVFAVPFVVDRGAPVFGSIGESFRLVGRSFGSVFLLLLTLVGVNVLGALPFGLGLLVTVPLSYLAIAFAFRRLTGGVIV